MSCIDIIDNERKVGTHTTHLHKINVYVFSPSLYVFVPPSPTLFVSLPPPLFCVCVGLGRGGGGGGLGGGGVGGWWGVADARLPHPERVLGALVNGSSFTRARIVVV